MKNYITLLISLSIFSFISWNVGNLIFDISLLPIILVLLTKSGLFDILGNQKIFKFKTLLDSPSKFLLYIKYDYLNGPIYYFIMSLIWIVCFVNLFKDIIEFNEVGSDIPLMFFCVSLVSLVMILTGYIKEYDKL